MQDGGQQGFLQIQILILILDTLKKNFIPVTNFPKKVHVLKKRIIPMVLGVMNFKNKSMK